MDLLLKVQDFVYYNIPPGPKTIHIRYVVNLFKGATFFYVIFLMWYYQNFSKGMYLYLGLHGSYGMIWLLKDIIFTDKSFAVPAKLGSLSIVSGLLTLYWMMAWFIASGLGIQEPSYDRIKVCLVVYLVGVSLMIGADAQKTFTLQYKKGLIDNGYFQRTRNPNYLGEVLLYASFAICTGYWASWIILLFVWSSLFTANMIIKDFNSLRKKSGWSEYEKRSFIFLPRVGQSILFNVVFYSAALSLAYLKYSGYTLQDLRAHLSQ